MLEHSPWKMVEDYFPIGMVYTLQETITYPTKRWKNHRLKSANQTLLGNVVFVYWRAPGTWKQPCMYYINQLDVNPNLYMTQLWGRWLWADELDTVSLSRKTWSCKGAPCNGLGGSIERSTRKFPRVRYPHFDTDQLPGFLRHEFGVFGLPVLEENRAASGISFPPKNRGQTIEKNTKLRVKIALIGEKKHTQKPWGQKNDQPKESTIRLFFHGRSIEKLPYIFAFSNTKDAI